MENKKFKITFRKHKREPFSYRDTTKSKVFVDGEQVGSISGNDDEGGVGYFFMVSWTPKLGLSHFRSTQIFGTEDDAKEAVKTFLKENINRRLKHFEVVIEVSQRYKVLEWAEDEAAAAAMAKEYTEQRMKAGRLSWLTSEGEPEIKPVVVK